MESLFLKVVNMSITGTYVIAAILLFRLLLRRAPKKYSYLLWAVVLFRLVCPVSYSSDLSLFNMNPFDMTTAQKSSDVSLSYVPADIGYTDSPKVTVGIPTVNAFVSDRLPAAPPAASVNPMQIWIAIGTTIWGLGVSAMLIYSLIAYFRLKRRMATAVRLDRHLFESDRISSPFVLGLIKPIIYMPFGLSDQERSYVLQHEEYHLTRKDHLIKPVMFLILAIHWFNPLVWVAFVLMSKDMEMSCDEKVLSKIGADHRKAYCTSLLAFAANRRFPSGVAFGEANVRERVVHILNFKEPKRWAAVLSSAACIAIIAACSANPIATKEPEGSEGLYGTYRFEKQIYMNPLSSFIAMDGHKEYYTLTENTLLITNGAGNQQRTEISYKRTTIDEQQFNNDFMIEGIGVPDIASYKTRYQYSLTDSSASPAYRLYLLDDEIWLATLHADSVNTQKSRYFWSIYKIDKLKGNAAGEPLTIAGTSSKVDAFLALQKNYETGYDNDTCYNITPDFIGENSDYMIFKYDKSAASFLLYEGVVYPLGEWFGGFGVTSMSLADLNGDGMSELYFTYSWGSGLHRSHAAYFDPAAKEVVNFNYVHPNEDLLFANNADGSLSLFAATLSGMDSFVNFQIGESEFISDIVYKKGQISLNEPRGL
ncbi:M56 family metallopeptidase [Paenibacillus sp. NPDC058174]|uniref:M56 family metallopeptidase n=1 Tax=Paenibacillus sp. NPDC058174 TaxID=3346366 RepID=UPI0036D94E15